MKIEITKPPEGETTQRIKSHLELAKSPLHRREISLTWDGYIAALLEWGIISPDEHKSSYELLKDNLKDDDPTLTILTGTSENGKNT